MRTATTTALVIASALLWACFGTPQPDPPNLVLDETRIEGFGGRGGELTVSGRSGAIDPAGTTLRITNLDDAGAPVDVVAEVDGSFSALVPGSPGNELRLQVVLGEDRSTPVDVQVIADVVGLAPRPLSHCLRTDPALMMAVDGAALVTVSNGCGFAVTLSRIELRRSSTPFDVVAPSTPVELAEGSTIDVQVTSTATADAEAVLLIETSSPEVDRRPVTLLDYGE